MSVQEVQQAQADTVLAKAIIKVADQLDLNQSHMAAVLGIHRTAFSRLKSTQSLSPTSKQGEIALMVIRLARALFALTGGDEKWMKRFMHSHNKLTGGVPADQITTLQGLMTVLRFVDAVRGKV